MFSVKYEELYNSVSLDISEMFDFRNKLDHGAVRNLKANKADVNSRINSNHVINGCKQILIHVSLLFNVMLLHSYVPDKMCLASLVPVQKDINK